MERSAMESIIGTPDDVNFTYTYTLSVEKYFDPVSAAEWVQNNWHISLYISAAYLVLTYLGIEKMSHRPKLELKTPLVIWNLAMAVFSTAGAVRFLPELYFVLSTFGFRYSICNVGSLYGDKVMAFWSLLFALSKVVELLDTAFIVLRKQKLIFLHWYHHATVLILTWYFYATFTSLGRWFACMNYFIHSVMYTYFAFRAMKFKVPRAMAMFVTTIQIVQTIFGAYVILYSAVAWMTNCKCQVSGDVVGLALLLYVSNFLLFAKFFVERYLPRKYKTSKTD